MKNNPNVNITLNNTTEKIVKTSIGKITYEGKIKIINLAVVAMNARRLLSLED
jgi:hypothetical protein